MYFCLYQPYPLAHHIAVVFQLSMGQTISPCNSYSLKKDLGLFITATLLCSEDNWCISHIQHCSKWL